MHGPSQRKPIHATSENQRCRSASAYEQSGWHFWCLISKMYNSHNPQFRMCKIPAYICKPNLGICIWACWFNSFLDSSDFCHLLITFAYSLDPEPESKLRGVIRTFADNSCHFYIAWSIELEVQHIILQHICSWSVTTCLMLVVYMRYSCRQGNTI